MRARAQGSHKRLLGCSSDGSIMGGQGDLEFEYQPLGFKAQMRTPIQLVA
jgi:hypothetical protein